MIVIKKKRKTFETKNGVYALAFYRFMPTFGPFSHNFCVTPRAHAA